MQEALKSHTGVSEARFRGNIMLTVAVKTIREMEVNVSVSNPPPSRFFQDSFRGRGRGSFRGRGGMRGDFGGARREGGETGSGSGGGDKKDSSVPAAAGKGKVGTGTESGGW